MNDFLERIAERYRRDENLEDEELRILGTLYFDNYRRKSHNKWRYCVS